MDNEKIKLLAQVLEQAPKEFEITLTVGTFRDYINETFDNTIDTKAKTMKAVFTPNKPNEAYIKGKKALNKLRYGF